MPVNTTNAYSLNPKPLGLTKKDPLKQQNDPFLRDLTACLQLKQQQKKLNEAVHTNTYANSTQSENSNGSFCSSQNQIESDFNLDTSESAKKSEISTSTKSRFNLNLNHTAASNVTANNIRSQTSAVSNASDKFSKPSFNLSVAAMPDKAGNRTHLELPTVKVRSTSPGALLSISTQPPVTSSTVSTPPLATSTTNGSYNVTIKTPILDRRCILNISCQSTANYSTPPQQEAKETIKRPENGPISALASATFLNAASILKLDDTNKMATPSSSISAPNVEQTHHKFKSPPVVMSSILAKPLIVPQKTSELPVEKDDTVVKTKLNHLKSFKFNSPTSIAATPTTIATNTIYTATLTSDTSPAKVYATISTQTDVVTNSVSTNTDLSNNLATHSVSVGSSSAELTDSSVSDDSSTSSSSYSQTNSSHEESSTSSLVTYTSELKRLNKGSTSTLTFDMEQFLKHMLYSEYNKNDLILLKQKFLPLLIESSSMVTVPRNVTFSQQGFIKSLYTLKNNLLKDIDFHKKQRQVSGICFALTGRHVYICRDCVNE